MENHESYMREALKEADKAKKKAEIPVGAVIVKNGEVIAKGYNTRQGSQLSTGHAEIVAIQKANRKLGSWRLEECDLYVTLEPCAMCAGAIIQARIRNLVFGADDIKAGACGSVVDLFGNLNWNHRTKVTKGVLKKECSNILSDFFKELRSNGNLQE